MFFVNHSQKDEAAPETQSHSNDYEAEFIVELCRYVVQQGYKTSQVVILTTYSSQLQKIRKLMKKHSILENVRATAVDNYQGQECDIVLVSFVRSNDDGNIGFLKDANRVNVALSRARKGLYCAGNFDFLAKNNELWQKITTNLSAQDAIGTALEIFCQNHTDEKTKVCSKEDFNAVPDGGCSRSCGYRMPCGHACEQSCHIIDKEHLNQYSKCFKPCDKVMTNCDPDHRCVQRCHYGKECGLCTNIVERTHPACGHKIKMECSADVTWMKCKQPCQRVRACGHKCKSICSENCESKPCLQEVQAISPCSHNVIVACSESKNVHTLLNACPEPCSMELLCGHLCKGSCGQCKMGRLHIR